MKNEGNAYNKYDWKRIIWESYLVELGVGRLRQQNAADRLGRGNETLDEDAIEQRNQTTSRLGWEKSGK